MFISSLNGRISVPLSGTYCASKFALEAAADALRIELALWQIPVIVVQPAQTDTDVWRTADAMVEQAAATMTPEYRDLYAKHIVSMKKFLRRFRPTAVPAVNVAAVVEALSVREPRAAISSGSDTHVCRRKVGETVAVRHESPRQNITAVLSHG